MRLQLVLASLCFITWMSSVFGTNGPAVSGCCPGWSKIRAPVEKIVNYTKQLDDICTIKAIVFETEAGRIICADPADNWTIRAIHAVDKRSMPLVNKENNEERSTSGITPVVASTIPKKVRSKRRYTKSQLRRYVKGRRNCNCNPN
ncbi:Eotaxin C-C motif chemokine 11 [Channa argus]|uniref:Eotaxin C-C motif chemokine 11 n=1 Tax=Channa argus TaxID=215402 RepID=A0A6G1QA57_CHAAH|nr:Eotaxin C-C motif chemokine 11 [Channa argus]KAK2895422.1 hypothetical protein Q8A73_014910 [Channa argus]